MIKEQHSTDFSNSASLVMRIKSEKSKFDAAKTQAAVREDK